MHLGWWLVRICSVLAAALIGMSIIFLVAANWHLLGRASHFSLLQILFLGSCLLALRHSRARIPLLLLAMLSMGALFAYFAQAYQSSANPCLLFATWAALSLPLCLTARSDALWTPWVLITSTALHLWLSENSASGWSVSTTYMDSYVICLLAALMLCVAMSPVLSRWTGAGAWPLRLAAMLTTLLATIIAVGFQLSSSPQFGLPFTIVVVAIIILLLPRFHDAFCHSVIALGVITLLLAWLTNLVSSNSIITELVLLGVSAAVMLTSTGYWLQWRHRQDTQASRS